MGDFSNFVWWVFCGLLSGIAFYGVTVLAKMGESINTLNVQIAAILAKITSHEKELERHDKRIEKIEEKI